MTTLPAEIDDEFNNALGQLNDAMRQRREAFDADQSAINAEARRMIERYRALQGKKPKAEPFPLTAHQRQGYELWKRELSTYLTMTPDEHSIEAMRAFSLAVKTIFGD